jgi:hypothetical protein
MKKWPKTFEGQFQPEILYPVCMYDITVGNYIFRHANSQKKKNSPVSFLRLLKVTSHTIKNCLLREIPG